LLQNCTEIPLSIDGLFLNCRSLASKALLARLLPSLKAMAPRMGADKGGLKMISELISYAVLASVFVVTGLKMFIDKPGKPSELPFLRTEHKSENENCPRESSEV
jgi:hypothetical protein